MKRLLILMLPLLTGALAACDTDSYDSGTGEYSLMTGDLVDVYTDDDGYISSFVTDDDTEYQLTQRMKASFASSPDSVYRALLYYNLVEGSDYLAEPVSIGEVAVLSIFTPDSIERQNTDPIDLESVWMSKNNKYVNMGIYIKVGTSDDIIDYQTIGMMRDSTVANADGTYTLYLTLYHSQGDVPEYYSQKYYLSMRTDDLVAGVVLHAYDHEITTIMADTVSISFNTYDDGVVTRVVPVADD